MAEAPARRAGRRHQRTSNRADSRGDTTMIKGTAISRPYAPLSDDHVKKIHRAALEVLETIGMAKATQRVLDVALANGCRQDASGRLQFPRPVVETCLTAAKSFPVHGRDPALDFEARNGLVNFATGGAVVKMLDRQSRTYRSSTLADLYELARVADDLKNIQWFARPVVATDIADNFDLDVNTIYACAADTTKHISRPASLDGCSLVGTAATDVRLHLAFGGQHDLSRALSGDDAPFRQFHRDQFAGRGGERDAAAAGGIGPLRRSTYADGWTC